MLAAIPYPNRQDPYTTFTSVSVICRSHPQTAGLGHVVEAINDFFPVHASWTLQMASERGYPRLIKILLAHETEQVVDMRFVAAVCNRGIDAAASAGKHWVLEDFIRQFPGLVITHGAIEAARGGHIHIMHWLHTQTERVCWTPRVLEEAVYGGHTGVVQYLCKHSLVAITSHTLELAVIRRHVDMAEWLWVDAALRDDFSSMESALPYATLPVAKALWARSSKNVRISIDIPAGRGDIAFILWATAQGVTIATTNAMDRAASNGHLDVVMYLAANRSEGCTSTAMDMAAFFGHLPVIKWMRANTTAQFTSKALFNAATQGHLNVLIWLDKHRGDIRYPADTFDCACGQGQLGVITWMSAAGVGHPTHRAMDFAAQNGELEVVIWLAMNRREGCSVDAMDRAAMAGEFDVVKWLHENRHEGCTVAAMDGAARAGRLDIIEWLHANRSEGCTVTAMVNAARRGSLQIVEWLDRNREEGPTRAALDAAISSDDTKLVEWFQRNTDVGCTESGVCAAIQNGDFEMLEYLRLQDLAICSRMAFSSALVANRLYIASWVRFHYLHEPRDAEDRYYRMNGWTRDVVRAAFD